MDADDDLLTVFVIVSGHPDECPPTALLPWLSNTPRFADFDNIISLQQYTLKM